MDRVGKWKKVHPRGKLLRKVCSTLAYSVNYSVQQISNQRTAIRDVAKFTFSDPRADIHWLLIVDIRLWNTASAIFPTKCTRPCHQFSLDHLSACRTNSRRVEDVRLYAVWAVQQELIEHLSTAKTYSWRLILFFRKGSLWKKPWPGLWKLQRDCLTSVFRYVRVVDQISSCYTVIEHVN